MCSVFYIVKANSVANLVLFMGDINTSHPKRNSHHSAKP